MTFHHPHPRHPVAGDPPSRLLGHLDRHGADLLAVIEAVDDVFLIDDTERALALAEEPAPDMGQIRARLRLVLEALESVSFERLFRNARGYGGPDLVAAARWHGARLAELLD